MIQFFTMLIFIYKVDGAPTEMQSQIMFKNYDECVQAMDHSFFDDIIYKDPRMTHIMCRQTDIISNTPRPRARPENLAPNL